MAVVNTQTTAFASGTSVVITKPVGLAVDHLLYATIGYIGEGTSASRTFTTPGGWTLGAKTEGTLTATGGYNGIATFWKLATSGDVSASNFTFSISGTGMIAGALTAVSDVYTTEPVRVVETDSTTSGGATFAFTSTTTPLAPTSLLITSLLGDDLSLSATPSVSAYTSTPSGTFTEQADIGRKNGTNGGVLAMATSPLSSTTQVTAYGATISEALTTQLGTIGVITTRTQVTAPVIESTSASQMAGSTITKPTGLAEGDLMLAIVMDEDYTSAVVSLPGGWTELSRGYNDANDYIDYVIGYKVADASDVAASNFTFTNAEGGVIYRISNCTPSLISMGAQTPIIPANLAIVVGMSADNDSDWASFSGYSVTGASNTITERYDFHQDAGFRCSMGIGDGAYDSVTPITAFDVTVTQNQDDLDSIYKGLILVPGVASTLGTTSLLSTSGSIFVPGAQAGTTGTNALLTGSTEIFAPASRATQPTQWTNETKPSTAWDNETP